MTGSCCRWSWRRGSILGEDAPVVSGEHTAGDVERADDVAVAGGVDRIVEAREGGMHQVFVGTDLELHVAIVVVAVIRHVESGVIGRMPWFVEETFDASGSTEKEQPPKETPLTWSRLTCSSNTFMPR